MAKSTTTTAESVFDDIFAAALGAGAVQKMAARIRRTDATGKTEAKLSACPAGATAAAYGKAAAYGTTVTHTLGDKDNQNSRNFTVTGAAATSAAVKVFNIGAEEEEEAAEKKPTAAERRAKADPVAANGQG